MRILSTIQPHGALLDISKKTFLKSFKGSLYFDSLELSKNSANSPEIINNKLLSVYDVESNIEEPELAKLTLEAIEDFCLVNDDKRLFKGLKLTENGLRNGFFEYEPENKTIVFRFGTNFKGAAKNLYNRGEMLSDNPKHIIYQALAEYLSEFQDFQECNSCQGCENKKLKFPKIELSASREIEPFIKNPQNNSYREIEDAILFVEREYGIYAWFKNADMANDFISAVKKITDAAGDKTIFERLVVLEGDKRLFDLLDGRNKKRGNTACFAYNNEIQYSPYCDWNGNKCSLTYLRRFHSTPNSDHPWIHELAHILEQKALNGNKDTREFVDFERASAANVSRYAIDSVHEFCAEYTCAKLCGACYPKKVDEIFDKYWLGCKLNF